MAQHMSDIQTLVWTVLASIQNQHHEVPLQDTAQLFRFSQETQHPNIEAQSGLPTMA